MADTKQKALDYFKSNADTKEIYATSDGFLFLKKADATEHAKALNADSPQVEKFTPESETEESKTNDSSVSKETENKSEENKADTSVTTDSAKSKKTEK